MLLISIKLRGILLRVRAFNKVIRCHTRCHTRRVALLLQGPLGCTLRLVWRSKNGPDVGASILRVEDWRGYMFP